MSKLNCWEIKKCGREPGGAKNQDLGICPAASETSCNGINSGKNAGRICWAIAGTFCGGKVQGDFAQKSVSCMSCEVLKKVREEEGVDNFTLLRPGQVYQASFK
ncbi:MAG: hypothetical protein GXP46_02245 [Deferribacteres bacterium]|nr:hypothetical protein [Deferribacteres bacterium]